MSASLADPFPRRHNGAAIDSIAHDLGLGEAGGKLASTNITSRHSYPLQLAVLLYSWDRVPYAVQSCRGDRSLARVNALELALMDRM